MEEYQILKKKLDVPDNLMSILTRLVSNEESRVLVLVTEKFLTASAAAGEFGERRRKSLQYLRHSTRKVSFIGRQLMMMKLTGAKAFMTSSDRILKSIGMMR